MSSLTGLFSEIAGAIREKKGTTEPIVASNFPSEILSIEGGGGTGGTGNLQEKAVTPSTQDQIVLPDEGYDGLSKVIVTGDSDLVPSNIKNGVNLFGVQGQYLPDLTGVGTTVTVEAMTALNKGQRLYCVPNDKFSQNNIGYSHMSNVPTQLSDDLVVGLKAQTISSTTESVSLMFWNTENNTYESVVIPISGWAGSSSKSCSLNPEGTLAMFWHNGSSAPSSSQKTLVLEIDKENKTATPYMITTGANFRPQYSSSICRGIFKNYVFNFADKNIIHRYNFDTHDFTKLTSADTVNNVPTNVTTMNRVKWLSDNVMIYSGGYIMKFVFNDDDTFSYSQSAISGGGNLNEDCTMMVVSGNSYYRFYSLNTSDLTFTLIADYVPADIGESTYSGGCQIYGNLLFTNYNIHDITNVATGTTIIYTDSYKITPEKTMTFNPNAWVSTATSTNIRRLHYPQGSEAQYLAYHYDNTAMTSGRTYGIASSDLSAGDIGTAQLLFYGG